MSGVSPLRRRLVLGSPIGPLTAVLERSAVLALAFGEPTGAAARLPDAPDAGIARALRLALEAYFEGRCLDPAVPLALRGTAYQLRVWRALRAIPAGSLRRYGELAAVAGGSARAVGGACRANPLPLLVPCHRVVGTTGLTGFQGARDGDPLVLKRWLIEHEAAAAGS